MITYDTEIDNLSYTNKDFNSIYNELLDLVDKISPKWKPSISNESDPGVILLKLDALMADKANYNIDKNILELFPSSVTQYPNAREIFEQCGYTMHHYKAAELIVSLNIKSSKELYKKVLEVAEDESDNEEYKNQVYYIPQFTQVSDNSNENIYTIIEKIELKGNQDQSHVKAYQGIIKDYQINNDRKITYNNLDYNNRLYFSETNIAENGIFISNIRGGNDSNNYTDWIKVENLLVEPLNTPCYKFGVSKETGDCYIEFPSDIANIIEEGLYIKYILTDGYNGNVSSRIISKFFNDTKASVKNPKSTNNEMLEISVTSEDIYITNTKPSENGLDPESIAEARKNYEKIKNTFNTLVSLRDYNNFLATSDELSSGFACDRTNDIQSSYKIVSYDGDIESVKNKVSVSSKNVSPLLYDSSGNKYTGTALYIPTSDMNAFDLKLYGTRYINPINNESSFDLSFEPIKGVQINNIIDDMADVKSIQHDIKAAEYNKIAAIYLRYPIKAKIIPYSKLTTLQEIDIISKIAKTLYENLNAAKLGFGETLDYNLVYDMIMDSDTRIKALILDEFTYTADVMYYQDREPKYITLGSGDTTNSDILSKFENEIHAKCILAGVTPLIERADNFNYGLNQNYLQIIDNISKVDTNTELTIKFNDDGIASLKLLPNESIYLTAPNFITSQTYSSYIKYFYNINTNGDATISLSKDDIYQLQGEDYIVFFWKESTDSDKYTYIKYKSTSNNPIYISPSFFMNGGTNVPASDPDSNYLSDKIGDVIKELDSDNKEQEIRSNLEINGYNANEIISATRQNCILDGTKSISIKNKNEVILGKDNNLPRAYWVLNRSEEYTNKNEYRYVLFHSDDTSYTLKTGEYLFYTNSTNSIFSMVGPGTEISRTGTGSEISVAARSYKDIMVGTNNLLTQDDLWYQLKSEETFTLKEMQFFNIGEGATIKFKDNNFKDVTKALSTVKINNESIAYYTYGSADSAIDYNVEISYEYEEVLNYLPKLHVKANNSWVGYSILNINSSNTKFQKLILNSGEEDRYNRKQSIKFPGTSINPIMSGDKFTQNEIFIQTNHPVEVIGGTAIDIQYYDLLGKSYPISFYLFTKTEADGVKVEDISTLIIPLPKNTIGSADSEGYELKFNLPSSASEDSIYIIPLITNINYEIFVINDSPTSYQAETNTYLAINNKAYTEKGIHFIKYTVSKDSSSQQTIYIHTKSESTASKETTADIRILPPIRCSSNSVDRLYYYKTEIDGTKTKTDTELFKKIKSLDYDNEFNYIYEVPEDKKIELPLDPKSFLDPNHPYSKFTICKWDHESKDTSISITNNVK